MWYEDYHVHVAQVERPYGKRRRDVARIDLIFDS